MERAWGRTTSKPASGGSRQRKAEILQPPGTPGICTGTAKGSTEMRQSPTSGQRRSAKPSKFHARRLGPLHRNRSSRLGGKYAPRFVVSTVVFAFGRKL